ncbi:carbohydrate binding family 9 domain-containing protein [Flavobacteriaceae bacterium]|nr:carbohydrate binding family 9 domain-containing protein [Flavobacteriaceae bacterium]
MKFYISPAIILFLSIIIGINPLSSSAQELEKRSVFVKKISDKIQLDGILDEVIWDQAEIATDFWQMFPTDSLRSTNSTTVKLLYDDTHIYIGAKAIGIGADFMVSSLKRDFSARSNDNVTFLFDTFRDGQNAFLFGVNAYGVQREGLISDRGVAISGFNLTWDIKWLAESTINGDSFTIEIAIPLNSIKYPEGSQRWGFQSYRYDMQSNERSSWSPVPQNQIPVNLGFLGELVFEKPLSKNKTPLYLIPYTNILSSNDFSANPTSNSITLGGDLKIAVGNGLNLDVTLNPDFSNVEVDNIITNLTRFEISLPEKRQFFIDNGDLFGNFGGSREAIPFFSRRIGIAKDPDGNTIQNNILGGIRLSGKLDENWRIGFLSIQNQEDLNNQITSNNNAMFALQRKIFNQSQIGAFIVNRESVKDYEFLKDEDRYNRVIGLDYNLNSANNRWTGKFYTHKSFQPDDNEGNLSSGGSIAYNTRIWQFSSKLIYVDQDFRSDLGFIPRSGIIKTGISGGRTFYPKKGKINSHSIQLSDYSWYQKSLDYQKTDHNRRLEYTMELKKQDQLAFTIRDQYIFLSSAFDPTRSENGIPLTSDEGYNFNEWSLEYQSNVARLFNFSSEVSYGSFFNGTRFSVKGTTQFRVQPKLAMSLLWDYNQIRLPNPYPSANIILVSPKIELTLNKKLFWSTLVQYSNQTENLGINSRLQWRFAPLSDLFLVYNDNYYTREFGPVYRSINLKLTYWLSL